MEWILQNTATIIGVAVLVLIVALILRKIIRDRQRGKTCGGDCASCPQSKRDNGCGG